MTGWVKATVRRLLADFESGTPKWRLAQQYSISQSSVKRLLRECRTKEFESRLHHRVNGGLTCIFPARRSLSTPSAIVAKAVSSKLCRVRRPASRTASTYRHPGCTCGDGERVVVRLKFQSANMRSGDVTSGYVLCSPR